MSRSPRDALPGFRMFFCRDAVNQPARRFRTRTVCCPDDRPGNSGRPNDLPYTDVSGETHTTDGFLRKRLSDGWHTKTISGYAPTNSWRTHPAVPDGQFSPCAARTCVHFRQTGVEDERRVWAEHAEVPLPSASGVRRWVGRQMILPGLRIPAGSRACLTAV